MPDSENGSLLAAISSRILDSMECWEDLQLSIWLCWDERHIQHLSWGPSEIRQIKKSGLLSHQISPESSIRDVKNVQVQNQKNPKQTVWEAGEGEDKKLLKFNLCRWTFSPSAPRSTMSEVIKSQAALYDIPKYFALPGPIPL